MLAMPRSLRPSRTSSRTSPELAEISSAVSPCSLPASSLSTCGRRSSAIVGLEAIRTGIVGAVLISAWTESALRSSRRAAL